MLVGKPSHMPASLAAAKLQACVSAAMRTNTKPDVGDWRLGPRNERALLRPAFNRTLSPTLTCPMPCCDAKKRTPARKVRLQSQSLTLIMSTCTRELTAWARSRLMISLVTTLFSTRPRSHPAFPSWLYNRLRHNSCHRRLNSSRRPRCSRLRAMRKFLTRRISSSLSVVSTTSSPGWIRCSMT
eukprot:892142-Pleurochrysis_carterae.AAC.5